MVGVDASIPLSVQAPQLMTPFQAYAQMTGLQAAQQQKTLRDQEIQQNALAMKDQVALSQAASNKDNIDPTTGLLKPEALAASGVSPSTTQKMTAAYREAQWKVAQTEYEKSREAVEANKAKTEALHPIMEEAYNAYERVLKQNGGPSNPQAVQLATEASNEVQSKGFADIKKTGKGGFSNETQFQIIPPQTLYDKLNKHKEEEARAEKDKTPFMRESEKLAELEAAGKGNTKEAKDLRKHIDKLDAPARTTIILPPGITEANKDMHGEEFLKTVKPDEQATVKAIAEGRETFSSMGYRGADRQRMVKLVNQYDPEYDQGKAPAKFAVRRDFTAGPTSKNITSINTAIGHMETLDKLSQALNNKDTQGVNKIVNSVASYFGKPEINNQELATQAVGDELMRTFRQVGASEHEANAWQAKFNSANSPEKLRGAVETGADLLSSRIRSVDDQWKRGMETENGFPNLLSPHSKEVMERFGFKNPRESPKSDKSAGKDMPTFSSKEELQKAIADKKIKAGDTFVDPNGKKHTVQ